jgi:hypothetical protein
MNRSDDAYERHRRALMGGNAVVSVTLAAVDRGRPFR